MEKTIITELPAGTEPGGYDRLKELKEFDDTKLGVKGLVDAGIQKVPRIFIRSPEELANELPNGTHMFQDVVNQKQKKMEEFNYEKIIEEFQTVTKDAERVQIDTLRKILEENSEAEYLHKLGLNGRTDPETFKSCVPLCTHMDLEPYIQRMLDGDDSPILTGEPITTFSLSSGTTQGKQKYVPFNEYYMKSIMKIFQTSYAFRNREYPLDNGKALQFIYSSKSFKTEVGYFISTASSNVYRDSLFKNTMKSMQSQCCCPDEVIFGPDFHQNLYCHLVCGLIYRDEVQVVSAPFAYSIIHAFRTFENIWEDLCNDIRDGVLSSRITVPSVRDAMSKILNPNPELADLIYKKCLGLTNWYGVIPELFPNAKYVYGIMTGTMEPYVKKLRHYAGGLPLVSADYGASEGWIGVNVNPTLPPENVTFAALPDIAYFEFIPISGNHENQRVDDPADINAYIEPKPIGLAEVKVGEEYEIVITNALGMYRYRLGDVVKVKSFHNSTPELQFSRRNTLLLTINVDKNTERDLQRSVEAATKLLVDEKVEVLDFTSHVDMSTDLGHYVIFWELSGEPNEEVLKECCNSLDQNFVDPAYIHSRKVGTIGPLELRVVRKGTFQKLLDHSLSLGTAGSQYKTPRVVGTNNKKVFQIMCENVAKSYFSTAY